MFKKIAIAAALSLAASAAVAAMPIGAYIGADVGATKVDDMDGNKASIGAFLGYGFTPNVAVELGYRQHGKWDYYGSDIKIKQTHVSVIGAIPLNNKLDLYGRIGYSNAKVTADYRGYHGEDDTNTTLVGIGLSTNFTANLFGRVEVQKPASDTTNVGVSLIWKF
jgi:opacity protein-like surface antigen